mgnify:CR=1 FL=1|tara:strand:- start:1183 stop:1431 length:249 start_codon:yes stop_codon:yes gene_type:complete
MGRANEMEKDIEVLKLEVKKLENIVRGMSSSISDIGNKTTDKKETDNGKKANDEGDGKTSSSTDKSNRSSNGKTKKNRNSSK